MMNSANSYYGYYIENSNEILRYFFLLHFFLGQYLWLLPATDNQKKKKTNDLGIEKKILSGLISFEKRIKSLRYNVKRLFIHFEQTQTKKNENFTKLVKIE